MAAGNSKSNFELYYHPYSICSLMALYTLSLRGMPKDGRSEMEVVTQVIDIFHEEQLSEHFLCNVNKYGQVPVLLNLAGRERPITDSLEMTLYMASRYPDLIPSQYEQEIQQSLTDLHELNYFSLSFPGRPQAAQGLVKAVQKRLDDPHNSDQYQTALEFKMAVVQNDKVAGMVASETAKNEEKARKLLAALTDRLAQPHEWIYGGKPTALDAHLVPFIARMIDVGRGNLIPEKLHEYSNWAMKREEWVKMMNGRKCTMIPVNEM